MKKHSILSFLLVVSMLVGIFGTMALPAAADDGGIYNTAISNLDSPYHNCTPDKAVSVNGNLELVSVRYTMFGKDLDRLERGDAIAIEIRVRAKSGKTLLDGGKTYWVEQGIWSNPIQKISDTEGVYIFPWNVDARPSQIIDTVRLEVNAPIIGAAPADMNAYSMTNGVEVVNLTWEPSPARFEEAASYTAKVLFRLDDENLVFCENFLNNGTVYINNREAKLSGYSSTGGVKDKFASDRFYASLAIPSEIGASAGGEGDMPPEYGLISIDYCDDIKMVVGETKTITMMADIDFMLTSHLEIQWYKSVSPYYGTGDPIPGANGVSLDIREDEAGDYYYYCAITGELDGIPYTSVHAEADMCRVTVIERVGPAYGFEIKPVDDNPYYFVYSPDEDFTLEVEPVNTAGRVVTYRWYECDKWGNILDDRILGNGQALLLFGIPLEMMMAPLNYLCVAECGGETDEAIFQCMLCPPEYDVPFAVSAAEGFDYVDGAWEYGVYSEDEDFTFDTVVSGDHGREVTYRWYRADENGNITDANPVGNGQALLMFGIPAELMMIPQYYLCVAACGMETSSVLFRGILLPMGFEEEPEEYVFPFTDVLETDWFYTYVEQANRLGLINGKSATTYEPQSSMTWAEAIKLACCLHLLERGLDPNSLGNGPVNWYSTYMDYALANGILASDMSHIANVPITRAEYVTIFCRAVSANTLGAKNNIPDGSIPDVAGPETEQERAIYTFYRAGIVNGTDEYGTFKPDANVIRAEVAAILVRIVAPANRVAAPVNLGGK